MDELFKYTVMCDPFDVAAWRSMFDESERLQETLNRKTLATAHELGQDVFDSVWKYAPMLRPSEEVDPIYEFNRNLIEKAMGTQEYQRLRTVTRGEREASAIATEVISRELMENLPEEDRNAVNEYAKRQVDLQKAAAQLKALSGLSQLTPQLKKLQARLSKKMPALQNAVQQAQQAFNQACQNPAVKAAFRGAINTALSDIEMVNDFAGGWGMEPGQVTKLPGKDRLQLMRHIQNSQKIRELAKILGRFKRLAFQKRYTRVTKEPSEIADITMGRNISRVISSELTNLAIPARRPYFYAKYVKSELLQYELEGREMFGRGPIIVCVDNSGSMGMDSGGITREMWAKAVGLSLAEIALRDRRTIEWINFGSRSELEKVVVEPNMSPGERLKRLMDVAETFFNSGTDFERPLSEAVRDIDKQEFKKADVIMVTDGECDFSEEFEKEFKAVKEKKQFRLHSVIIGGTAVSLEKVSDVVHHLYDLLTQGDDVAGKIFEAV